MQQVYNLKMRFPVKCILTILALIHRHCGIGSIGSRFDSRGRITHLPGGQPAAGGTARAGK